MSLAEQAPPRPSIVTRGRDWTRGVQLSGLAVVVALAAVAGYWWLQRSDAQPSDTARTFLSSTSCPQLYDLASDTGDKNLADVGCDSMIAAAKGQRTYADQQTRLLTRTLHVGGTTTTDDTAQVAIRVSYAGVVPAETVMVELSRTGRSWRVDDWGLPAR